MFKEMITLKEIAEQCGVSIATVSNIVNGKENVGEKTKQKVLQLIEETGFRPNNMARRLRASVTHTIGIIIEDLTVFSSPGIIEGCMSCLDEHGYTTILENLRLYTKLGEKWYKKELSSHIASEAIKEMLAIKVDGIIYVAGHAREIELEFTKIPVPIVITYAFPSVDTIKNVMIDDKKSAVDMIDYLIKQGKKKIAVIAGSQGNVHTIKRLEGYKETLLKNNIQFDADLIVYSNWERDGGYNSCKQLYESKKSFGSGSGCSCCLFLLKLQTGKYSVEQQN